MTISQTLVEWVSQTILLLGYPGIGFLMTLESIILPLPSEAILPFAGYLVSQGALNLWLVALAATLGSLVGSTISYGIGRYGGRPFIEEYGKYFLITPEHLRTSERLFDRYGPRVVFFGRLLPVVRHFISIPAGITRMRPRTFFLYTAIGAFVWNLALTWTGFALGANWERITDFTAPIEIGLVVIILLVLTWYILKAIERRNTTIGKMDTTGKVARGIKRVRRDVTLTISSKLRKKRR